MEVISNVLVGAVKVEIMKNITFNPNKLNYYYEIFDSLKKDGYVTADKFESHIWSIKDELEGRPIQFLFDIEIHQELNIALKGYILVKRLSGTTIGTLQRQYWLIKHAILKSRGLMKLNDLEQYLHSLSTVSAYTLSWSLQSFLSFYPIQNNDQINQILQTVVYPDNSNRDLPPFDQIFQFDDLINLYSRLEPKNSQRKQYFYIVELWWYITNIVPMRPNEFLRIRYYCLDLRNHTYWLEIPRSKSISESPEKEIWYQWIQVTEEVHNFIRDFQSTYQPISDSNYLIPFEYHQKYRKSNGRPKNGDDCKFLSTENLNYWIDRFYKEIIEDTFCNYEHQRIRGGDTRHFAIINMFLQGFNMLSISRMAGQSRIESPENYYSHMETLAKTYIFRLASIQQKERSIESQLSSGFFGLRRKAYDIGKMHDGEKNPYIRSLKYGQCKDQQFPRNCIEDCRDCPNFIFNPSAEEYQEAIHWLEDYSETINRKIERQVRMMESLFGKISRTNNVEDSSDLKHLSRGLQHFMDQKVVVDTQLLRNFIHNN
ncbi:hypothetical protein [Paenibacillus cymbidii]|uniref:hypothetical protein n=1 Tax=Paenibacillus cymbidii TaxID=1639034 RepID=UPI001081EEEF|nr:hypothetical protein [Paenibacillus cymbidii]